MVLDAGGKVVPSTDCGAAPNQVPGFSLHRELALFAEAGIPNGRVIELATRVAAEVLRQDADIGTVTPGKRADLLILGADPLLDINNTRTIETIVKDGNVYAPKALLEETLLVPYTRVCRPRCIVRRHDGAHIDAEPLAGGMSGRFGTISLTVAPSPPPMTIARTGLGCARRPGWTRNPW